jgi:O-antigen ligase
MTEKLLNITWFWVAVVALALAWLLPNHYPPWLAFHAEAWSALVLTVVAVGLVVRSSEAIRLSLVALVIGCVALVPLVQLATGQIAYGGTAWMSALYLVGLALAIQVGAYWHSRAGLEPADYLFTAITGAGAVSAILQIYQLMRWDFAGIWVMHVAGQTRFFANLAQPNQLGTLQLLGVLGCGWAYHRRALSGLLAPALCGLLLLGVALTGSRTAYINLLLILGLMLWIYRHPYGSKVRWAIGGLSIWFLLCVLSVPELEALFDSNESVRQMRTAISTSEPRLEIWRMFISASIEHPWIGWGWGQITTANFSVAEQFPDGLGQFNTTHNLFLDCIIWAGYPIAVTLLGFSVWWGVCLFRRSLDVEALYRVGFIVVMLIHAMFELPLHYAYFLLPFGVMLGTLVLHSEPTGGRTLRREALLLLLLLALLGELITVRDYLRIEAASYALRFEDRGIQTDRSFEPPRVLVLDQFSGYFELVRMKPAVGISKAGLQDMRDAVNATPSARTMFNLAANLGLNGESSEARHWLLTLCKTMNPANCNEARERWIVGGYPQATSISWPVH